MRKRQTRSKRFSNINPLTPEPEIILKAARIIQQGGVVVFPTRNLYGLAADALCVSAVERIFEIKQRPAERPLLVLINDKAALESVVREIPPAAAHLMEHFWPGNVTIVLAARDTLPKALTGGTGRVGVRLPGHPVASALVNAVGGPITGTSANLSGRGGCSNIAHLDDAVARQVDLILDAGPLKEGIGSTVVDVAQESASVLREGAVSIQELRSVLEAHSFKLIDNRA